MERITCLAYLTLFSWAAAVAEPPSNSYGTPSNQYGAPSDSYGPPSNSYGPPSSDGYSGFQGFRNSLSSSSVRGTDPAKLAQSFDGPKVFRHISLFIAPQENEPEQQTRIIRPQKSADKHVQIIFVKAPSSSSSQQTEVILPEQPQQKTLVYVLVKKATGENNVKVRGPAPTTPPKPEVYFIKYRDDGGNSGGYSGGSTGGGYSSNAFTPIRSPSISTSYGAP